MPGWTHRIGVAVALAGIASTEMTAQSPIRVQHVTLSLIPQLSRAAPSTTTGLALRLAIDPGWHVYFAHAGQSGIPTRVTWHLPPGVSVDSLRWPVPEKLVTEGLVSHVYSDHAVLFTSIHLHNPKAPVRIGATVTFGACQTQCLQGKAELTLAIPLGKPEVNPQWQSFTADYFSLPTAITGLSARAVRRNGSLEVWLSPPRAVPSLSGPLTFFPLDPAALDTCVTAPPVLSARHVSLLLGKPNAGATRLRGILTGWAGRALRVDVAIGSESMDERR
jgi:thiol:disulfide interchange protein DsbD